MGWQWGQTRPLSHDENQRVPQEKPLRIYGNVRMEDPDPDRDRDLVPPRWLNEIYFNFI